MADHQGTVWDIVDSAGTVRKHTEYDSFGQLTGEAFYDSAGAPINTAHAQAIDQLFYFAGQQRDEATGLQLHGARWYSADMGRFLSEDPIAADTNLYRYADNNPVSYVDPSGLRTLKPYDTLPALTGFGQGNLNPLANNPSLGNLNLGPQRPTLPNFQGPVNTELSRQAILNAPWPSDSLPRFNDGAGIVSPATVTVPTPRGRVVRAPSPPSLSLLNPNVLTNAGNAIRGAANYLAGGIENATATGNTGFLGTSTAVFGGLAAHGVRLTGGTVGGIVDVPGTVGGVIDDFRATGQVYNQYGAGAAAARQIGLLQGAEAVCGTDVLSFEQVDPFAKLSEATARLGGTAGAGAGFAGLSRLAIPDAPSTRPRVHGNSLDYVGDTHVYAVRGPQGTHKIGQSMQGVRKIDGASIRGEAQARKLIKETGQPYRSEVRKTFPDKRSSSAYETRYIETFRRLFGEDTLPGNKTNR